MLYFLTSPIAGASALHRETGNPCCFTINTQNTLKYHTWSQLNHPWLSKCSTVHQTGLAVCCPHAWCLSSVSLCKSPVSVKNTSSIEWKSMNSVAGISYYLNKCSMLLTCRWLDDSFVFQQHTAPVHLEFNTVAVQNSQLPFSWAKAQQQSRA